MAYIPKKKKTAYTDRKKQRQKLYNTRKWKDMSLLLRATYPICQMCNDAPSTECHHKKSPFQYGITQMEATQRMFDPDNIIVVCHDCHMEEHNKDKKENIG